MKTKIKPHLPPSPIISLIDDPYYWQQEEHLPIPTPRERQELKQIFINIERRRVK